MLVDRNLRIIIADDHSLILNGFKNLIESKLPNSDIYTVENKTSLFKLLGVYKIDILFQDIKFGKDDAREFLKCLKEIHPELRIVIISTLNDQDTVQTLSKQGIDGFISKSDNSEEILNAIEAVLSGEKYYSTDIQLNTTHLHLRDKSNIVLTRREKEVLAAIVDGKTIKESADILFLSEKTIESYRSNLFLKFEVNNVATLVKKAILEGFL